MHLANHERQESCSLLNFLILCAPTVSRTRFVNPSFISLTKLKLHSKVSLIVGDYFKVETVYIKHSKMACDLISWLHSKTYVLARLRDVQTQSRRSPLTVIHAVLTRWTVHYLAFRRLLELHRPLQVLMNQDTMASSDQKVLCPSGSTVANKRKAIDMIAIIDDSSFWHSLARCKPFFYLRKSLTYF
jgi:hypothetical protein